MDAKITSREETDSARRLSMCLSEQNQPTLIKLGILRSYFSHKFQLYVNVDAGQDASDEAQRP